MNQYKHFDFFKENQFKKTWEKNRNIKEIFGKTVTIFGCGNIGSTCATYLKALGCNVLGIDLNKDNIKYFDNIYDISRSDECISISDIIIITLPLNESTRNFFDINKLSLIKDDTILINISRGAILDTKALIEILKYKKINVYLDVFEKEPLSCDDEIWTIKNIHITPHNSFYGENNRKRMQKTIINNLLQEYK